ncbi:MAG: nitric oxide reductase activation protein NorD [Gammaproteobacteria bacterium]
MSLNLDEYRAALAQAAPELAATLDGIFHEAARVMSPAGLRTYLDGARGLAGLGRGTDLVISYLEEMPAVVQECGEDVIPDCINAALKLSSMTSGEVIGLLFASLPTAAQRLGDPELLRSYLNLIHRLSAKAPRGLRPLLKHIDELLSKLTLSGLRRWANFGAQAYRQDLSKLVDYFSLATEDSRAVLQQERRGTLFVDSQRKLNFYLRALWGRDFQLRPTAADHADFRPYIEARTLHLPDAVDDAGETSGLELYRATAAHMAAHISYTDRPLSAEQLSPAQMFFIGLLEDARVEYCAAREFPGLRKLWRALHVARPDRPAEHPALNELERLALCLLDGGARSGDAELDALAARFHAEVETRRRDTRLSWDLGLELYHLFAARRAVPALRILQAIRLPYRDDNRYCWSFEEFAWSDADVIAAAQRQVRRRVSVMDMVNEVDCELAGDDAQEIWTLASEFFRDGDPEGVSVNQLEGKEPVSDPFHYHEWDYQVQLHRPNWATVYERRPPAGDPASIEQILREHKPVAARIRQIVDLLRPAGVTRQRKLEDGDEIDVNAAVEAMVNLRLGLSPDPRITQRNVLNTRDLCVLLLLDLSESTNELVADAGKSVLALTREASTLMATAIEGIGDPFAVHGFASDGRHDVRYFRVKDFNQPFDDAAKGRIAGMNGGLSTRMGAALRHAARHLLQQPQRRKLVLLVTDGEPADVDERDPQYLRYDARKAVEELHTRGIVTYCLSLDPQADGYVRRIFGATHYTVIDHVQRLPERLPVLFASLTR